MEKKKVAILCAVVAATACFVTALLTVNIVTAKQGSDLQLEGSSYADLEKYLEFDDLEKIIGETYYQDITEDELVDGALRGMVRALGDPYSVYYTDAEYQEYQEASEGKFVGIGVEVSPFEDTGELLIHAVYKGGPAFESGMTAGEVITAVDGLALKDLDFDGAGELLSGPSGSSVNVTVRTADGASKEYSLVRTEVQTPYVAYSMLDEDIAYIVIQKFHGDCAQEFSDALKAITEEENAKGVVIDLRNNLGGSVSDATAMLDELLPEGVLVYSINKEGDRKDWTSAASYNDIPITLLVNENSASASEIFAGAIQDYQRGQVIGTQTYGKGVTQITVDMPYSGGGVKLTNAVYYTPNGRDINGVGLTPDQVVDLPDGVTTPTLETDTQLQAAMQTLQGEIS